MPDLQVFNLFNSTPCNPDCVPERTGELMLPWEVMLTFESIWLVDTSRFSRMPHCKTNSFSKFGGPFFPTFEWNSLRFWLFLHSSSLIKQKSIVIWGCSTSVFMHDWEGLSILLCYWSTDLNFVLQLTAVKAFIPPKGRWIPPQPILFCSQYP